MVAARRPQAGRAERMANDPDKATVEPERGGEVASLPIPPREPARLATPTRSELRLQARVDELEAQLDDVRLCLEDAERRAAELVSLRGRLRDAEHDLERAEEELAHFHRSVSWRVTAPLRLLKRIARRLLGRR